MHDAEEQAFRCRDCRMAWHPGQTEGYQLISPCLGTLSLTFVLWSQPFILYFPVLHRLKDKLSQALAFRANPPLQSKFNADSPANLAIRVLDNLILGDNVSCCPWVYMGDPTVLITLQPNKLYFDEDSLHLQAKLIHSYISTWEF